jgi:hypothetical protein
MARGEPVDLDDAAILETCGYILPSYDDEACCDCNLCSSADDYYGDDDGEAAEISPNEVTVSFTDFNHDTVVDVLVDSDGDFWLKDDGGSEILLSPAGAERLFEILGEALYG